VRFRSRVCESTLEENLEMLRLPISLCFGRALSSAVEHQYHTLGVAGSNPAARTIFPQEIDSTLESRTLFAQNSHERNRELKFPMVVKYRNVQAKIYRKSKRYPFYRLAFAAEGKRRVRTFKTLAAVRAAAKGIVRQIAKGNAAAASLSLKEAHAYKFAVNKLRDLAADLNCRKTDMTAPDVVFSLEDAIVEFVEAKRALGGRRLAEAVTAYLSTVSEVRRVKVRDAVEEFLREREAKTKPEKAGARPQLSPKMAYQDRSRMRPFVAAFQMDVCDLRPEHFDLFFQEHLKGLVAKTRNGYRSTLHFWIKWCVRKGYLTQSHRLDESNGLSPDGKKQELADTGDIEFYSPQEFVDLLANSDGQLQPLIAQR
jgi:hypothetical protein